MLVLTITHSLGKKLWLAQLILSRVTPGSLQGRIVGLLRFELQILGQVYTRFCLWESSLTALHLVPTGIK